MHPKTKTKKGGRPLAFAGAREWRGQRAQKFRQFFAFGQFRYLNEKSGLAPKTKTKKGGRPLAFAGARERRGSAHKNSDSFSLLDNFVI